MSYLKHINSFLLTLFLLFSNNLFAEEGDTYNFTWLDQDKEVYVLQNRKYRKKNKLHINLGGGKTVSGAFVDASTWQGRAGYFFRESWGLEFLYAKNSGSENDTAFTLRNRGASGSTPFRRIVENYMGAMVLWSPFYSKINTFNEIIYFDWILGLGYGQLEEVNNNSEFTTGVVSATTKQHNGPMWNAGLKFYLSENFDFRLDLTVFHYEAQIASTDPNAGKDWYSNWDLAASFGINF